MLCSVTVRFRSPSWKDKVFNCDLRIAFNFFDDGPSKKVFTTRPGNTICWSSSMQVDPSVTRGVLHGGYQLVFMSPEALIGCKHWQEMLLTRKYKDDLVALVVDEAHCVKTW